MSTSSNITIANPTIANARPHHALSEEDIRCKAPSVFAGHARTGLSSHYTFVSTAQVLDSLRDEGWEVVRAREQRVRLPERVGFQMHELRLARRADLENFTVHVGQTRPEMILQNSHDGSRAYRIDAGLYRIVCSNGLTVADADFAHVAIRHVDVSAENFAKAARDIAENTPRVLETVAKWLAIELTPTARIEFARRAIALRWGGDKPIAKLLPPESILLPVRYGDSAANLWVTYNVAQEWLQRGGSAYAGIADNGYYRRGRTRALKDIKTSQALNKSLWSLAAEFAAN